MRSKVRLLLQSGSIFKTGNVSVRGLIVRVRRKIGLLYSHKGMIIRLFTLGVLNFLIKGAMTTHLESN